MGTVNLKIDSKCQQDILYTNLNVTMIFNIAKNVMVTLDIAIKGKGTGFKSEIHASMFCRLYNLPQAMRTYTMYLSHLP